MSTVINTGLLSFGMSGKVFHAPFIDAHKGFAFKAVTERNQKQAQQIYPEVISYNKVDDLIEDETLDLIIVNTPNYTHCEYAKAALLAGKHVLVEKPFAITVSEAQLLFELAEKQNKKIMVYQNRRYDSGFKLTKQVIESGQLGKLTDVYFRFDRYRNHIGPKKFKEEPVPGSGLLYDLGPHLLDQAIALFGKPLNFYKVLSKNREHTQVDDYFFIHLQYPDQLNVYLHASMLVADIPASFIVNGTSGSFSKNHADVQEGQLLKGIKPTAEIYGVEHKEDMGKITLMEENGERKVIRPASLKGNYMELFDAVYATLVNDVPFPVTQQDILTQIEILEF
ncbi:Gfo/Idh/MocA family oxidoreductase [Pedobacter montanisoli]|uniref:Gfo/Idh/MocA family oxidoreductase n=1 Tax=Pedobacter montanisoli TaxID=2923277 RepID=A0ABS9ZV65_9SPHI|nr:Gfo/Idh/MocA family oxidoreductase [Pedobacter montanisoli]MCJ0742074.1 Gfo/Idh/MocA family oxidoreductase [Pedobacter montanisoli]